MNVELLKKIVKFAEEEPRRFDMGTWYADATAVLQGDADFDYFVSDASLERSLTGQNKLPPCGTIACLAGTACILSGAAEVIREIDLGSVILKEYADPVGGWFMAGQAALGLTKPQAQRLFFPSAKFVEHLRDKPQHWPEPYASEYEKVKADPAKRVAVMRRRVKHFIKTDGAE